MTVSLTIIRYKKRHIFFALLAMVLFRLPLKFGGRTRFWKLMGSGKNGTFSKSADWQQWAILVTSKLKFKHVQLKNTAPELVIRKLYGKYIAKWIDFFDCEHITYILDPLEGHGLWDGKKPFGDLPAESDHTGAIGVLTRATIRSSKSKEFWKNVDAVSAKMADSPGFITSYGIGEVPRIKQATFSVWQNKEAMQKFAYQTHEHQDVIQKTRSQNWYSEDMFVRFKIDGCVGSLNGYNPLKGKL